MEALGTNWTSLYIGFAVKDRAARHKLLAESLEKGWSPVDLRFEVQRRYPNKRHGVGGRPAGKQRGHGPEVALREMERLSRRWLAFHDTAWSKIQPAGWKRLLRAWYRDDRDSLRRLLQDVDDRLEKLIRQAQKVRRTVGLLRKRVGQAQGGR